MVHIIWTMLYGHRITVNQSMISTWPLFQIDQWVGCSDFGSLYRGITVGDHFASSEKKSSTPRKKSTEFCLFPGFRVSGFRIWTWFWPTDTGQNPDRLSADDRLSYRLHNNGVLNILHKISSRSAMIHGPWL